MLETPWLCNAALLAALASDDQAGLHLLLLLLVVMLLLMMVRLSPRCLLLLLQPLGLAAAIPCWLHWLYCCLLLLLLADTACLLALCTTKVMWRERVAVLLLCFAMCLVYCCCLYC
jgi:hypothetical protein